MTEALAVSAPVPTRTCNITVGQRVSGLLFGSPSLIRALGGFHGSVPSKKLIANDEPHSANDTGNTSVYAIDRRGRECAERLPRIWISEPVVRESNSADASLAPAGAQRVFVATYPNGADRGGWHAYDLAETVFAEALTLAGTQEHARRIECFQAAEILYLHAASRGNIQAHCRLGILYADDLCEGQYWCDRLEGRALHHRETPCAQRAYRHFLYAACHDHAESCWRLGDMVQTGTACARNESRAWSLYRHAFDLERESSYENRASTGNAALRLARASELGRGCPQDFRRARSWYRVAACNLGAAFDQGQWHFKRERAEARLGVARMAQEISGCY